MDEHQIHWPVKLSDALKQQLLETSKTINSLEQFEVSTDYWKIDGLFYIYSGLMTIGYSSENPSRTISSIVGPTDWVGASTLFSAGEYVFRMAHLTDIEIVYFPRNKLEQIARTSPEVFELLFKCASLNFPHWIKSTLVCMHERKVRLVFTLVMLLEKTNAGKTEFDPELHVTQNQLSEIIGVTRPRVNEALKDLELEGFISLGRSRITILNIEGLKTKTRELSILNEF